MIANLGGTFFSAWVSRRYFGPVCDTPMVCFIGGRSIFSVCWVMSFADLLDSLLPIADLDLVSSGHCVL